VAQAVEALWLPQKKPYDKLARYGLEPKDFRRLVTDPEDGPA